MSVTPNSAITPQNPASKVVALNLTAVGSYTGSSPTNLVPIVAPTRFNGSRLKRLVVRPRDTTLAGRILLFKSEDAGSTKLLVDSKDVAAYTWSSTAGPGATHCADFLFSDASPGTLGGNGSSATEQFFVGGSVTQTGGGYVAYAEWDDY